MNVRLFLATIATMMMTMLPKTAMGQIKLLVIAEKGQPEAFQSFESGISEAQTANPGVTFDVQKIEVSNNEIQKDLFPVNTFLD